MQQLHVAGERLATTQTCHETCLQPQIQCLDKGWDVNRGKII